MDIEKLTKSQLVMLALLVSFMTSISTGIVTVALMQQAPPSITQSVSKVVERTVERVVSAQPAAASTIAPQVKTVVVKESPTLTQAVDAILPSTVRLFTTGETSVFLAMGIVVHSDGTIVTDAVALNQATHVIADTQTGLHVEFAVTGVNSAGVAFLKPSTTTSTRWQPAAVSKDKSSLGDAIVAVTGKSSTKIYPGVVVSFSPDDEKDKKARLVETNIATDTVLPGSPLLNTSGSIVGMLTLEAHKAGSGNFLTSENILIPLIVKAEKTDLKETTATSSTNQ